MGYSVCIGRESGHHTTNNRPMTNQEMQAALADMLRQWDKAKAAAMDAHPEWTAEQVNQAVENAMTAALKGI